ncbi:MAG: cytochrome c oxidase subunit I [Halobacteria archaeon]
MACDVAKPERSEFAEKLLHWLTTTNHKEIGILYTLTGLIFFVVAGAAALLIRAQLATPEGTVVSADVFNSLFTLHGLTMVFLAGMPIISGFANYLVPLQIGAKDLPFPRINALSFWLIPTGGIILFSGLLTGRGPDMGWTLYAPYSSGAGVGLARPAADLALLGLLFLGASSIATSINFLTMILRMRAPTMGLRMPLFTWSVLVTVFLLLLAMPVLTAGLAMLYLDLTLHTGFFNPALGGDPVLWQHLFWFFGHPEVYILILPSFGIVSEVIPVFSRRPIFGYWAMAGAIASIGLISYIVWVHHMFTTSVPQSLKTIMMLTTYLVGVPTGIKIFNWLATLWNGKLHFKTPMLFALGLVSMFTIGGITGIFLASIPLDIPLQDTYFVVAHFHYVLFGGTILGFFAGLYFWFPKMTGRMYHEGLGKLHFALTLIGFNMTFWPMHELGMAGMPRRIATYSADTGWGPLNLVATVGAFMLGLAQLVMMANFLRSRKHGRPAGSNPWGASGLEWTVSSPPPPHNFDGVPVVTEAPGESHHKSPGGGAFMRRLLGK